MVSVVDRPATRRDGRDGSLLVHQDAGLLAAALAPGERVEHVLAPGRRAWLQVVRGAVLLNGTALATGDGAAVSDESRLLVEGVEDADLLLFDLA